MTRAGAYWPRLSRSRACAATLRVQGSHSMPERHPDLVWAESGAMMLTGYADGPPLLAPAAFAAHARAMLAAIRDTALAARLPTAKELEAIDGAALLGERAA